MARVAVETYQDLSREFGEEKAKIIIKAIEDIDDLATKRDLLELNNQMVNEMLKLKVELIKWNVGTMVAMTAIFGLLLKLFG